MMVRNSDERIPYLIQSSDTINLQVDFNAVIEVQVYRSLPFRINFI